MFWFVVFLYFWATSLFFSCSSSFLKETSCFPDLLLSFFPACVCVLWRSVHCVILHSGVKQVSSVVERGGFDFRMLVRLVNGNARELGKLLHVSVSGSFTHTLSHSFILNIITPNSSNIATWPVALCLNYNALGSPLASDLDGPMSVEFCLLHATGLLKFRPHYQTYLGEGNSTTWLGLPG